MQQLRHAVSRSQEAMDGFVGISAGTVKSQSADALASLRRALAPSFGVALGTEDVR